jgi:hypothetical protein
VIALRKEIINFEQKEKETLGGAWARFISLKNTGPDLSLPDHIFLSHFYHGLSKEAALHLDTSSGGSFIHMSFSEGEAILEKILENTPYTGIYDEFPKEEKEVKPSPDQQEIHATESKIQSNPSNDLVVEKSPTKSTQPTLEDDEPNPPMFPVEIEDGLFEDFGNASNFPLLVKAFGVLYTI